MTEGSRTGADPDPDPTTVAPSPPLEPTPSLATEPVEATMGAIEDVSTRRLLGASFDLLSHTSEEMRRASFYIGSIVLGTVGPLALASWAAGVVAIDRAPAEMEARFAGVGGSALSVAGFLAMAGLIVALVESRTMSVALLGARVSGRPITPRQALARSRHVFWRAVVAAVIVAIPLGIAQAIVAALVDPIPAAAEFSVLTTTLVTATIGSPFAYVLAGVVLGDVDPIEAVRRSFRVFGARKGAAAIVVTFETIATLLIFLGVTTGLDVALRVLGALGLGFDSGPAGLALITGGIVAVVFAFGTLVFTVIGLTVAPQVVMFVALTHATMGVDRVRNGAPDDPDAPPRRGVRRFRTWTRPMLAGMALGALVLAVAVSDFAR